MNRLVGRKSACAVRCCAVDALGVGKKKEEKERERGNSRVWKVSRREERRSAVAAGSKV